jgi:hypothetical protein
MFPERHQHAAGDANENIALQVGWGHFQCSKRIALRERGPHDSHRHVIIFDRHLHLHSMSLSFTPLLRLKRGQACDHAHSSLECPPPLTIRTFYDGITLKARAWLQGSLKANQTRSSLILAGDHVLLNPAVFGFPRSMIGVACVNRLQQSVAISFIWF